MNEKMLDEVVLKAKATGSYFVTATIKDKTKTENDLVHYALREDFPTDDIIPSLDHCVRLLNIKPETPVPVTIPKPLRIPREKLKIAIITHFNRCPDSYSPCKAVKNQIKMLQKYGHEVVFFTQEGSVLNVGCEMRPVVPKFKREKNIVNEEAKKKFIDVLRENLTTDFNLAITHDFYIDDCITYREAIRECGVPIKWLHWARSGVGHKIDFSMENAHYVYMNMADVGRFARNISVDPDKVRVVFNEKDPSLLFKWNPVTKMVSEKLRLWEKDIIQTYPMCTTRMDAKGINSVIKVFSELKKLGKNVALIICNANGKKRPDEIKRKIEWAKDAGLDENDFLFTNTLEHPDYPQLISEAPYETVVHLMQISNLFIFPTIAEVCSNVLLEASMNKNLIVINDDLPSLYDFVDKEAVLYYPFTSLQSIHYDKKENVFFERLGKKIIGQLESNKADKQFRHVWGVHNLENIYFNQLEPLLYE